MVVYNTFGCYNFLSFYFLVLEPKQILEDVVEQNSSGMSTCHVEAITTKYCNF